MDRTRLDLATTLSHIEILDMNNNYKDRYVLVLKAMYLASMLDYETGIRVDTEMGSDILWWISFIILPNFGEISWHNPSSIREYDGYSTKEKYKRCNDYSNLVNDLHP
jgi:hypothetical protein